MINLPTNFVIKEDIRPLPEWIVAGAIDCPHSRKIAGTLDCTEVFWNVVVAMLCLATAMCLTLSVAAEM